MEQAVAKQMEEQAEKEVVKLPETIDGKKVRYILKSGRKKLCTCVSGSCSDNLPAGILENAAKEGADASQGAALT